MTISLNLNWMVFFSVMLGTVVAILLLATICGLIAKITENLDDRIAKEKRNACKL